MTTKISQKDAVHNAVTQVLKETGIEFKEGENASTYMNKERRALVNQILYTGFKEGKIEITGEKSDVGLKQYVSGLQSNWLSKDKRLNGMQLHVVKNPGSRIGSADPQMKALRTLLKTIPQENKESRDEIQHYINLRAKELEAQKVKAKQVKVNVQDLPEELQVKHTG